MGLAAVRSRGRWPRPVPSSVSGRLDHLVVGQGAATGPGAAGLGQPEGRVGGDMPVGDGPGKEGPQGGDGGLPGRAARAAGSAALRRVAASSTTPWRSVTRELVEAPVAEHGDSDAEVGHVRPRRARAKGAGDHFDVGGDRRSRWCGAGGHEVDEPKPIASARSSSARAARRRSVMAATPAPEPAGWSRNATRVLDGGRRQADTRHDDVFGGHDDGALRKEPQGPSPSPTQRGTCHLNPRTGRP